MRMNLRRVAKSRSLNSQSFTILRSTGHYLNGRWLENPATEIAVVGLITVANEIDLEQIPEIDRVRGGMNFVCDTEMFVTRNTGDTSTEGTSDKIVWQGDIYKIFQVAPWVDYGFFAAIGSRIKGS